MNSNRSFLRAAVVAALTLASSFAGATAINGSGTGLAAPGRLITFDEHVLKQDTPITTQYADLGVTFNPGLYFSPFDPDADYYTPVIAGNFLSNYTTGQNPAQLGSFSLSFATLQTRAAFGLAANDSGFTFTAMLGGQVVESFTAGDVSFAYYGFVDSLFDSIVVTNLYDDAPDFFDFDNLQFDALALSTPSAILPNSAVPEPELGALMGLGLLVAHAARRRSSRRSLARKAA